MSKYRIKVKNKQLELIQQILFLLNLPQSKSHGEYEKLDF